MMNDFDISITGRARDIKETETSADGRRFICFELTPKDGITGSTAVKCISFGAFADYSGHFLTRGDLIAVSGVISSVDFYTQLGRHLYESSILNVRQIDFKKEGQSDRMQA